MAARGAGSMQVIAVPRPPSATARARKRVECPDPISTIRRGSVGAQDGVGGGGVEPREPVLVEARRTVAGRDRVELARRRADVVEHRPEPGLRRLKQRPQGRVAHRRDRAGMAVGDEEAARREPEDRREAEAEPARLPSHDQTGGPGVPGGGGVVAGPIRSRQECARRARSNSSTTTSAIMKGMRR